MVEFIVTRTKACEPLLRRTGVGARPRIAGPPGSVTCAKSQFSRLSKQERLERINRAQDLFGDPVQRRDNRLTFEGKSNVEEYRRGRMAFILYCKVLPVKLFQLDCPGFVGNKDIFQRPFFSIFVLKADIGDVHDLQDWNKELMLVPNIQVLQSPKEVIPRPGRVLSS